MNMFSRMVGYFIVVVVLMFGVANGQGQKQQLNIPENFDELPKTTQEDILIQLEYVSELKANLTEEYTIQFQQWNTGVSRVSDYKYTIERILKPVPEESDFSVTVCSNKPNSTDKLGGVNTITKVFGILKSDIDSLGRLGDEMYVKYNQQYFYPEVFVRSTSTVKYDLTEQGVPFVFVRGPTERGYNITNFEELGVFDAECAL